jgi:hypothetical protein
MIFTADMSARHRSARESLVEIGIAVKNEIAVENEIGIFKSSVIPHTLSA